MCDDQRVDRILRQRVAIALLGDRDTLCRGWDISEHPIVDEAVVHDDIGGPQRSNRLERKQFGIARTSPDEDDASACFGIERTWHAEPFAPRRTRLQHSDT